MKPIKLLFVLGTRPEAVKLGPLIRQSQRDPRFQTKVCSTGQHREMLKPVFELFSIRPDHDFDLMKPGQNLNQLTRSILEKLQAVLQSDPPDWLVVQGDTTSTMAGALCAFYEKIPVVHVEAGLRTGDIHSPFPEELNRRVVGLLAGLHFPPTEASAQALRNEGVPEQRIFTVGNTGIDALLWTRRTIEGTQGPSGASGGFSFLDPRKKMILVTLHRRESFGEPMRRVMKALRTLSQRPDVELVIPLHMNPQVRAMAREVLTEATWVTEASKPGDSNIWLLEPLDYVSFVRAMARSHLILTDSGGVQEEAPSLGKPILVVRESTERPEGLAAGTSKLVGTRTEVILAEASRLLDDPRAYELMAQAKNPFGDGMSSSRILDRLAAER